MSCLWKRQTGPQKHRIKPMSLLSCIRMHGDWIGISVSSVFVRISGLLTHFMQLRIVDSILHDLGIARVQSMPQLPVKERRIKGNCKGVPLKNCLFGCKKPISTRIYLLQHMLTVLFKDACESLNLHILWQNGFV